MQDFNGEDIKNKLQDYLKWDESNLLAGDGILAAADKHLEWILPWWWMHLSRHVHLPVTFIDYGMSEKGVHWCRERGNVIAISIPDYFFRKRSALPIPMENKFMGVEKNIQQLIRKIWFLKPFSLVRTPYRRTLWLDIDCQVNGDISKIFDYAENPLKMALTQPLEEEIKAKIKLNMLNPGEKFFNAGVIPYLRNSALIKEWGEVLCLSDRQFFGAEDALAWIINQDHLNVCSFPAIYNWSVKRLGFNSKAHIIHWTGNSKKKIMKENITNPNLNRLYRDMNLSNPKIN